MGSGERVTHCPICGEANACHLSDSRIKFDDRDGSSAGKEPSAGNEPSARKKYPIEDCWCAKVKSKLDVELLPDSLDNSPTSCICQKCWEKYQEK